MEEQGAWKPRPRQCGVCGVANIPFGVDWPWWEGGRPVHPQCIGLRFIKQMQAALEKKETVAFWCPCGYHVERDAVDAVPTPPCPHCGAPLCQVVGGTVSELEAFLAGLTGNG